MTLWFTNSVSMSVTECDALEERQATVFKGNINVGSTTVPEVSRVSF